MQNNPPSDRGPGSGHESLARNRDFVLFLSSRGGTVFGNQILSVAVGWHIYSITGEVFNLALVGLFQFLPMLVLFLFAGLAADRADRRVIVSLCNFIHGISTALIGLYLFTGPESVWPVFGLLAVHGAAQAFLHPASQAILPNLVRRSDFSRAVATGSSVMKMGHLVGPAVGGLLIALVNEWTYLVAAILFSIAGSAAMAIKTRLVQTAAEPFRIRTVLEGFRYVWNKKAILGAISIDLVAVLFGGIMGLLPVFAIDILNVGPEGLGLMRAAPGAGALLVGLTLARTQLPWHAGRTFFWSLGLFGTSILVFSLSANYWLSIAALTVYGGTDMISVYIRQTLVQIETPDALRGRVSAVNSVSINASNELGDFRAGTMAAFMGAVPAVFVGALVTLSVTAIWWRAFPALRKFSQL